MRPHNVNWLIHNIPNCSSLILFCHRLPAASSNSRRLRIFFTLKSWIQSVEMNIWLLWNMQKWIAYRKSASTLVSSLAIPIKIQKPRPIALINSSFTAMIMSRWLIIFNVHRLDIICNWIEWYLPVTLAVVTRWIIAFIFNWKYKYIYKSADSIQLSCERNLCKQCFWHIGHFRLFAARWRPSSTARVLIDVTFRGMHANKLT